MNGNPAGLGALAALGQPGARPYEPPPTPGSFTTPMSAANAKCRAERVLLAGGALNNTLTDRDTNPFEQVFRRLPEQGIHSPTISTQKPFVLELGSFQVPKEMALLLFDIRPDVYRFSGIDPNDAVPFEARRFGSQMGYDFTINGSHQGKTRFELEPIPRQEGLAFSPLLGTDTLNNPGYLPRPSAFAQARANRFGASSGAGLALMPQRHFRYGPTSLPLTLMLSENDVAEFKAVIFKPIQSPVAFFEMDMAGLLMPLNKAKALLECIRLSGGGVT